MMEPRTVMFEPESVIEPFAAVVSCTFFDTVIAPSGLNTSSEPKPSSSSRSSVRTTVARRSCGSATGASLTSENSGTTEFPACRAN